MKKGGINVNINIQKKHVLFLTGLVVLLVGVGFVVAYSGVDPNVHGHPDTINLIDSLKVRPVVQSYNSLSGDHYYKVGVYRYSEGYVNEGIAFYAFYPYFKAVPGTVPIYKYYNSVTEDHYYKLSESIPSGYVAEGIAFYAYGSQEQGAVPIYKYYNSVTGDHYCKQSTNVPNGYVAEGIAFYAYDTYDILEFLD